MTAFATVPAGSLAATRAVATISTTTSFTPYKDLVLSVGSRGAAVRTLQRALAGIAVDGVFGSVTRAISSAVGPVAARSAAISSAAAKNCGTCSGGNCASARMLPPLLVSSGQFEPTNGE